MYLFRIHIRPQGGSADMYTTFEYCKKNKVLGVGWRTQTGNNTKDWDEYYNEASTIHDNLQVCAYIKKWVSEGDLVWTRDPNSQYYLARVVSGWEYWMTEEAKSKDIDIANIFRCEMYLADIDDVPGKVVACFRPTRSIQEIADGNAREYSKQLWNSLSKSNTYQVNKTDYSDIFMMLDDEETEDVLFLFLQSQGWYLLPNSRKGDTMSFEYFAVNPQTGERALAQVKTGNTGINKNDYSQYKNKIYLFQSNEKYCGDDRENIICIKRKEMIDFLNISKSWLPKSIVRKMEIVYG